MNKVLVVEDDKDLRELIYRTLKDSYQVLQAEDRSQACEVMRRTPVDLVLLDLHLPPKVNTPEEGMKILEEMGKTDRQIKVVVITGDREQETSLRAISDGAYDYFSKPFDFEEMKIVIKRALYIKSLERENRRLRQELAREAQFDNIIGKSDKMKSIFEIIRIVAHSDCTVLIRGESGTGKELVATTIHDNGPRSDKPFVALNCAAIPEALLESELFGYEKGAFTDANKGKPGKFELASDGTLFLDEVADMSLAMQAKILRAVQDRTFERLGGTKPIKVNTRLMAATNKNLEELMRKEAFREDLYYRLNVVSIYVPALRERKKDISLLADHFLRKYKSRDTKKTKRISAHVLRLLVDYEWPGNVRELENVIERAVVLGREDTLQAGDISSGIGRMLSKSSVASSSTNVSMAETEKNLIEETLKVARWNQTEAAKLLGIHRNTLRRRIKHFQIHPR